MNKQYFVPSKTGVGDVCVWEWETASPKAVLQVTHGMAEHMARYDGFGSYLAANGVAMVGMDLAGHGKSIGEGGIAGYLGESGGWENLVLDMRALFLAAKEKYPNVPYIMMGHSMGSFLTRTYCGRYDDMDGVIISGTAGKNPAIGAAKAIAAAQIALRGGKAKSELLNKLSFGSYNSAFKPNRTEFDWLSRDEGEVDKYAADPLCGFVFTASAFRELFYGLSLIAGEDWARRTAMKPIYIFSGACDPVGGMGKGVREVADMLSATGHDVTLKLYDGGRHEMLNELNRDEVYGDVLNFIERLA